MRDSLRQFGSDNQTDVILEDLVDSPTVELTVNDNTIYSFIWLDAKKGPQPADEVFGFPDSVLKLRYQAVL